MSRRPRPHLPGSTFHLTTRLHRREELFTPALRTQIVGIIRDELSVTDADLLAYAIMPNHFHLVIRQGRAPLPSFMQPIVRRAALLVQREHGREGYVFERRYRDRACADPDHLRNAIVYTHLNPVRAGLCRSPNEYAWTSHGAWTGNPVASDGRADPAVVDLGLPLYASDARRGRADLVADYVSFLDWRAEIDQRNGDVGIDGRTAAACRRQPNLLHGDATWMQTMTPRSPWASAERPGPELPPNGASTRADLSEIAALALSETGSGLDPAVLRSRWGGPTYVRARHNFIRKAASVGYRGVQIASYLHVTTQAVSRVLAADRKRAVCRRRAA